MDRPKAILIAGDDESEFDLICRALENRYRLVRGFPQFETATELVDPARIDLVLLTNRLPEDGLHFLSAMQSVLPTVPVLVLAEAPDRDFIIAAFRRGATDFLLKPIQEDELLESVERAIHRRPGGRACGGHSSESKSVPQLKVLCLGRFQAFLNEQPIVKWPSRKGKAIFAYLAVHHRKRLYQDVLMDTFWPGVLPDCARDSLHVAIYGIRRLLRAVGPAHDYILFDEETYFINPEVELWIDVEEFERCRKAVDAAERGDGFLTALDYAAGLYGGDFMEDCLYESWAASERQRLRESHLNVLERLSEHYGSHGNLSAAIKLCETILERDPCREDVHRRLMECYRRLGKRDRALKQFRKCAEVLKSELETIPTAATLELYEQIRGVAFALSASGEVFSGD